MAGMNEIEKAIFLFENANVLNANAIRQELKHIIKALEAQQADRWISVTDRLPNRAGTYLGTVKFNDDSIGVFPVWWHNGIRTDISWEMDKCNVNVITWKPLPEPYKEERL